MHTSKCLIDNTSSDLIAWSTVGLHKFQVSQQERIGTFLGLEDTVTLPYTYFGLGTFTNERESFTEENGIKHPTLLFDIVLDDAVPEDYHIDFEIPKTK